jgi:predicted RNA-binding protein associated with RNAse of E/G family
LKPEAGKIPRPIVVIKRNLAGEETWRYPGVILRQQTSGVLVEARFNRNDLPFMGIVLQQDDRFLETYFTERWYNIFEIHDRRDDRIKGWYCNISKPAVLEASDRLSYIDLALDLWVTPGGVQTILDEDEFEALELNAATRSRARAALEELRQEFANKGAPGLD